MPREFGLWSECPEGVPVAYGARWILEKNCAFETWAQKGHGPAPKMWSVSGVPGRGGVDGDEALCQPFLDLLNAGPHKAALERAEEIADESDWFSVGALHTLYEDDNVVVKGDSRSSYGYVYVVAWPKRVEVLRPIENLSEESGCTEQSLYNARKIEAIHGRPVVLDLLSDHLDWTVTALYPTGFKFEFTGFSWGYGGEGPRGLCTLLSRLGLAVTMDTIVRWPQNNFEKRIVVAEGGSL